jgi:hypothetical protein
MTCKAKARCFGVKFCDRPTMGLEGGNTLNHFIIWEFFCEHIWPLDQGLDFQVSLVRPNCNELTINLKYSTSHMCHELEYNALLLRLAPNRSYKIYG